MSQKEKALVPSDSLGGFSRRQITATRLVRTMAGQTQSCLMQCDDGNLYVVKAPCPSQGPNVLANEVLGNLLARGFGLPVAADALVTLSPNLADKHGGPLWPFLPDSGRCGPMVDRFYGSRFVGEPEGENRTIQYIGSSEITRLRNRADFLGMLMLDVWANHQDLRQAVYTPNSLDRSLFATFIDNGQMFGGANCRWSEKSYCFYYHMDVYRSIWTEKHVDTWMSRFHSRARKILANHLEGVPQEWYDDQHKGVAEVLANRLNRLEELLVPYRDRLKTQRYDQRDGFSFQADGLLCI